MCLIVSQARILTERILDPQLILTCRDQAVIHFTPCQNRERRVPPESLFDRILERALRNRRTVEPIVSDPNAASGLFQNRRMEEVPRAVAGASRARQTIEPRLRRQYRQCERHRDSAASQIGPHGVDPRSGARRHVTQPVMRRETQRPIGRSRVLSCREPHAMSGSGLRFFAIGRPRSVRLQTGLLANSRWGVTQSRRQEITES